LFDWGRRWTWSKLGAVCRGVGKFRRATKRKKVRRRTAGEISADVSGEKGVMCFDNLPREHIGVGGSADRGQDSSIRTTLNKTRNEPLDTSVLRQQGKGRGKPHTEIT